MKLGFWSGQRKSTLWCFWFYFSKALKVIISCCWIPVAVAPHHFISGLRPSGREQVLSRQGLCVLIRALLETVGTLTWRPCLCKSGEQRSPSCPGRGLMVAWWREHREPSRVPPPLQVRLGHEPKKNGAWSCGSPSFSFTEPWWLPGILGTEKWGCSWCRRGSSLCPSSLCVHSLSWMRSLWVLFMSSRVCQMWRIGVRVSHPDPHLRKSPN